MTKWSVLGICVLLGSQTPVTTDSGRQAPPAPLPRLAHATAYHAGLGLVVVFGGTNGAGDVLGDLWGWDGTRWRLVDDGTHGPAPRSRHAMAYDPAAGRLVIHGGGTVERDLDDTWAWSSAAGWAKLDAGGPGARSHHQMAYDPAARTVVLYGGGRTASGFGDDTWILREGRWQPTPATLSPGRVLAAMVSGDDGIFLFGGLVRGGPRSSELWKWERAAWHRRSAAGPPGVIYPGLAWNSSERLLLLFGGESALGLVGETWLWSGPDGWRRHEADDGPGPRTEHGLAYDAQRDVAVLVGGRTADGPSRDVWEWNGRRWSRRQ